MSDLAIAMLAFTGLAFVTAYGFDMLKKDFTARLGQLQSHLNALQGRFQDNEKKNAEAFRMAGAEIAKLEKKVMEALDSKVDAQAIDNISDEFFALKSTVQAMGQKGKKKKAKKRK